MSTSLETTSSRPIKRGESTAPSTNKDKKKITNANTDRLCLDDNSSLFGRLWYHLSLYNGLYLLDPREKAAFNTAGALFTVLTVLYLWSFGRGFVDGLGAPLSPSAGPSSLVGQQTPQQQQQEALGVLLDPTGGGGIRSNDLLSAALRDSTASGAGSVDASSMVAPAARGGGGGAASDEL